MSKSRQGQMLAYGLTALLMLALAACEQKTEPEPEPAVEPEPEQVVEKPQKPLTSEDIHQQLLTLDSHIDVPTTLGTGDADPSVKSPMQVDLPSMREGGLDAAFFIVYVAQGPVDDDGYAAAYEAAQAKFTAIERMLADNPEEITLVTSPDQLKTTVADGKLAAAIGVENAYPLGKDFEHLQEFFDRGARYVSLTHFGHNHFSDSSVPKGEHDGIPEPTNEGLSDTGRALIDRMNALGIMVDVSHTSMQSTLDAVAHSKVPVIASHSGVRALYDHPRNLTDDEIKAIADGGGVVQLVAFDSYMREVSEANMAAANQVRIDLGLTQADWWRTASQTQIDEFRRARIALHDQFPRATVSDFVDHIDYVVKLVGIDHAGISSDFGGGGGVEGWDYISESAVVTEELIFRGYTNEQIEQIWSGNLLRVWAAAEAYAQELAP